MHGVSIYGVSTGIFAFLAEIVTKKIMKRHKFKLSLSKLGSVFFIFFTRLMHGHLLRKKKSIKNLYFYKIQHFMYKH